MNDKLNKFYQTSIGPPSKVAEPPQAPRDKPFDVYKLVPPVKRPEPEQVVIQDEPSPVIKSEKQQPKDELSPVEQKVAGLIKQILTFSNQISHHHTEFPAMIIDVVDFLFKLSPQESPFPLAINLTNSSNAHKDILVALEDKRCACDINQLIANAATNYMVP